MSSFCLCASPEAQAPFGNSIDSW